MRMQKCNIVVAILLSLCFFSCEKKGPDMGHPPGGIGKNFKPGAIKPAEPPSAEEKAYLAKIKTPEGLKSLKPEERARYNQDLAYAIYYNIREGEAEKVKKSAQTDANLGMIPTFQPNLKSRMGETFLTASVKAASVPLVKEFLKRGTDPRLKDANGKTPLELARDMKRKDIAALLSGGK